MEKQENMVIIEQSEIAKGIFRLVLKGSLVQSMKTPGQFLHLKIPSPDLVLRRPISLAEIDQNKQTCTLIYRVVGTGTQFLSTMKVGESLDILGPLGNGFPTEFLKAGDTAYLIGGGIGVPPLYELSRQLKQKGVQVQHFLGFATKEEIFYEEQFQALGETLIATDDGSYGTKGHVGTLLAANALIQPTAVYACGPNGLLKAVDQRFADHPHAYLSLEERMACGIGACYACVCHQKEEPTKSKKVCDEGPVFQTGEVLL